MKYEQKSFTVPASSAKAPKGCRHGWIDGKGKCVLCGVVAPAKAERKQIHPLTRLETKLGRRPTLADIYESIP